jgi:hypothetical protein
MAARGLDEGKQGQQVVRYSPAKPDPMLDAEIERCVGLLVYGIRAPTESAVLAVV